MKKILLLVLLPFLVQSQSQWIVDKSGNGNFTTIQDAFDAVPLDNKKRVEILVKPGIYYQKLHLAEGQDMVSLIGEDKFTTIITYDDHSGKIAPDGSTINTFTSHTIKLDAKDFTARNISFVNDAGFTAGQAVAAQVNGDRMMFDNCRFIGFQDVLLAAPSGSRQVYKNCYIEGTTDFIFGAAIVWFEKCHIHSKKKSHVTAASTPVDQVYGFVFNECILTGDSGLNGVSLGRPWKNGSAVTYLKCYLGSHIREEGWSVWNDTDKHLSSRYMEYKNFGPSSNVEKRLPWSKQLSTQEADEINTSHVFKDWQVSLKTQ